MLKQPSWFPSHPANQKVERQQDWKSSRDQNQRNKSQRQLRLPYRTTEVGYLNPTTWLSPSPQRAVLAPEPAVIRRAGRHGCRYREAKFWVTVRGVAVGGWGGPGPPLPGRWALSQVPLLGPWWPVMAKALRAESQGRLFCHLQTDSASRRVPRP